MMKSYIWLQTADGSIEQVEQEVAMICPIICQEMHTGVGSSKNYPISLPPQLNQSMLSLILDYCRFHQVPGHSNKERRSFDEKFIRMDTKTLCELTSAADSLQLKPLVDLTSRALARMIEGKSPEEIRETFHLPDDLTEEEKLEPLKNITDDPRIRLLNRLYARKRKELQERDRLKNVEAEEERLDDRSVDDLLSFINGGSKDTKTSKPKKKNSRRKGQQKNAPFNCTAVSNDASSSINAIEFHRKECNGLDSVCHDAKIHDHVRKMLKLQNFQGYSLAQEDEFDDGDLDDEIDPALKEKIDRRTKPQVYAKLLGTTNQSQSTTSTMLYTFHSTNSLARTHCSRLHLYNFISRFYVQLPLLLAKRTYSHPLCFMMTCSPDDPNCFVLLLYNCVSSRNGCICKPGDNKWRKNVAKMGSYEDVIYYNGELYAIDKHA